MSKITAIIDPSFKTGGEGNKKWTLMKVQVGDKEATGFSPANVGDIVDLTYSSQYKNYQFKVLKPGEIPTIDANEDMKDSGSLDASKHTSAIKEDNPLPAAEPDSRGDAITASMAVKLAYVEFVKCEGMLPKGETQWALVEANAETLIDIIQRLKSPQTGLEKARQASKKIQDKIVEPTDEQEDFSGVFDE